MNLSGPAVPPVFRKPKMAPLSVVRMIWKRKFMVAAVWIPVSLAVGVVVQSLPAIFKSEALIQVESQRIPERYVTATVNAELKDRLTAISQQIFSYKQFLAIVEKYDLYREDRQTHVQEEIIEMMRSDVGIQVDDTWTTKARSETRPSAFRISYQGPNPEVVAQVTNELATLFLDENLRSREKLAKGTSEFLNIQLGEAKKRLEEQEARMSEFKQRHNGELPEQEASLLASLAQLQVQWQAASDSLARAEQAKHMVHSAVASSEASEAAIAQLAEQLGNPETVKGGPEALRPSERLSLQLEQAQLIYTEEHPSIKALRNLIPRLRVEEAMEREKGQKRGASGDRPARESGEKATAPGLRVTSGTVALTETLIRERERTSSLKAQEEIADKQIKAAMENQEKLSKEVTEVRQRLALVPTREQELAVLRRDYEVSRANYQSLMDKGLAANMAAEMEMSQKGEKFKIIDNARVSEKPVKPNRPLFWALGGIFGLLFGFSVGIACEMKANTVLGEWELPKGVRVLARVPCIVPLVTAEESPGMRRRQRSRRWVWVTVLMLMAAGAVAGAAFLDWVHIPGIGGKNV